MKVNLSKFSITQMLEPNIERVEKSSQQIEDIADVKISESNQRLILKLSNLIEDMWTDIRYGRIISESPRIHVTPRKQHSATIKPIYGNINNEILLEIGDSGLQERIFLNRKKPEEFRYEHILHTDHGSATLKYHNSEKTPDQRMATHVNRLVKMYLSEIV